ncbi:Conserved protein of unknown function [Modestobacter italicus]|uniref:Alpha/beta hydrolase n=1 Tax=Modestobacter italicus (strain DSM 44449 / CECT 9708 / BC 501) TaxID=2732864 RepID=I4ETE3_MODI5|nr:alpha/beta hydrolase [Modestobacter marinus]CCH86656.1 Conserved protein of unknown function [Modestobacter marinus]
MRLPIIYVRGFAGDTRGIDRAVDDPFYGFNEGSVHVRVGGDAQPQFHQFESPLLRLMLDDDGGGTYRPLVQGGQRAFLEAQDDGSVPPRTIWVHRFYDRAASTFGQRPEAFTLERAAEDLYALVQLVRAKTGAPRVHLVAHSMGGLICRSMIQRVVPEATGRPDGAADVVDRLFTYGTPHGGIEFAVGFGLAEELRDFFDLGGAAVFGPDRMWDYLTPADRRDGGPPEGWDPAAMPADGFPLDRVFCLVGTDPADYGAAGGLASRAVGARSDGLVQIDHAYVPGAHRAFVHRSHSGRYGLVNSEEGYQNLRRFLFGDLQVTVELRGLTRPDPGDDVVWQLETQLAIRGLPVVVHEQTTAHQCPVQLEWPDPGTDDDSNPVPLLTTFLLSDQAPAPRPARLRHALRLRLISLREEHGCCRFGDHLEQTADVEDTLVVDIEPGLPCPRAWATWNSQIPGAIRDWEPAGPPIGDADGTTGVWCTEVPLPATARPVLGPRARVRLTVTARG